MASERRLAVVTGASSGIGLELARQFAEHSFDLVIAAEDDELGAAAAELGRRTNVLPVMVDLARYDGVEKLYAAVAATDRPLDAAALNAGIGLGGSFAVDQTLDDILRLVRLNVESTVHLAKRVLTDMAARVEGRVLFTSSIASTMPGPYQAVYNASKSFVQSFAQALADELRDSDITITSLMPGPTDTEFFERADLEDTKLANTTRDDPADVARQGFEALMDGRLKVVAGRWTNKVQAQAGRVLPDQVTAAAHRRMAEPGSVG